MPMTRPDCRSRLGLVVLMTAGWAGAAVAQNTPPSGARPNVQNRPVGPLVQFIASLRETIAQLDLTPEQRRTVTAVLQQELGRLREQAPALADLSPAERQSRFAELAGQLVGRIREPLTPDQRTTFDDRTRALLAGMGVPAAAPPAPPEGGEMMSGEGMMSGGDAMSGGGALSGGAMMGGPATRPTTVPPPATTRPASTDPLSPLTLVVGQPAPELSAIRLDNGRPASLASLPARPRVLVFGSQSAPTFRDQVAAINQLQRDYRSRAEVIVIYTAEAYPAGVWDIDRNRQDKVRIEVHRTEADRLAIAREARTVLGLEVSVLVDQMSNATATAYGLMPNGAVLVSRDGTVLAVQRWFDAHAMRRSLDEAIRSRPAAATP